jgi:sugar lactone lactonase YvrE
MTTTTLLTGLAIGESPRWHDGRLWFANWGPKEVVALDGDGRTEVVAHSPVAAAGYSIDWLPDGRMLLTGDELRRREPDGSLVRHADLTELTVGGWNEIVVDGRGNVYLNDVGFRFGQDDFAPGSIALVTPDDAARRVAEGIAFPNGMVVTPDNSTLIVAESFANVLTAFDIAEDGSLSNRRVWAATGGDGICLDAEGAIWCSAVGDEGPSCQRVAEGGEVLERIELEHPCFACMLGGEDGRTLFMMTADWRLAEDPGSNIERLTSGPPTGRILTARVSVPHAGRP